MLEAVDLTLSVDHPVVRLLCERIVFPTGEGNQDLNICVTSPLAG